LTVSTPPGDFASLYSLVPGWILTLSGLKKVLSDSTAEWEPFAPVLSEACRSFFAATAQDRDVWGRVEASGFRRFNESIVGRNTNELLSTTYMYGQGEEDLPGRMENTIRTITTLADHLNIKDETPKAPTFYGTKAGKFPMNQA